MNTMYDKLLQLPLFQGLAKNDLTRILEKVKLDFVKHRSGSNIAESGDPCSQLMFVLSGTVAVTTMAEDCSYSFTEYLDAPFLIESHSLFGMELKYHASYMAETEVHTVSVYKMGLFYELLNFEIFRLNYLNTLSSRVQRLNAKLWSGITVSTENLLKQFINVHIERPVGRICLRATMGALSAHLNDSRMNISKVLNIWKEQELIETHRGEIVIFNVAKLLSGAYNASPQHKNE